MKRTLFAAVTMLSSLLSGALMAEDRITRDIEFARVGERVLRLDLYKPLLAIKKPLVVYVHGGAWRGGLKDDMPLGDLVARGFPVASVDYRHSTAAQFPAQIHDIKAAIRFLRAKAKEHGVDSTVIAIAGSSAGGHLAALTGVSNGVKDLEGTVGTFLSESSNVQGIISLFGASNLETILSQSTPEGVRFRTPALELLLGGLPADKPALARLASPVTHVDSTDPPLLLIHGDADPQMPFAQSEELKRAFEKAKVPVEFEPIHGGKHGGEEFYDAKRTGLMEKFLTSLNAPPQKKEPEAATRK